MLGKNLQKHHIKNVGIEEKSILNSLLKHCLNSDDGITIRQAIFFSGIREFFVDDNNIFGKCYARPQQIVQAINRSEHPIDQRKI